MPADAYFGKEDLNRVSFLRTDEKFIKETLCFKNTVFIPFVQGDALCTKLDDKKGVTLTTTTLDEASDNFQKLIHDYVEVINTPDSRAVKTHISLTFLGLDTRDNNNIATADNLFIHEHSNMEYKGIPYYAINFYEKDNDYQNYSKLEFMDVFLLDNYTASLFSHAKMYIDWLIKLQFCTGCGHYVYPVEGGTKIHCANPDKSIHCIVRDSRVNNICFPRTDPTAIVIMVNESYDKICLVRSKRRIDDTHILYSNVAGFMEPGETIENACVREIWEETGIHCTSEDIKLIQSQPWPYPVNLMIGCLAIVKFNNSNEIVNLNHDPELLDAQWFNTTDIITALDNEQEGFFIPFLDNLYIPGKQAIAYNLLEYVINKYKSLGT